MPFTYTKSACLRVAFRCLSALLLVQLGLCLDTNSGGLCQDGTPTTAFLIAPYMGKEVRSWTCPLNSTSRDVEVSHGGDDPKYFDLCSASCTTYCQEPLLDGGPNEEDCNVLTSYYSSNGRFTIEPKKYVVWEYNTCRVVQYNRLPNGQGISYCFNRENCAGVVTHLSSHCGSHHGSHGGICYFYDSIHFSSIVLERA